MAGRSPIGRANRRALLFIAYAWLIYGAVFFFLFPRFGQIVSGLVLIPVVVSAWYGGMAYALLAVMVTFPFNMYIFLLADMPPIPLADHISDNIVALLFGFGVGYVGETRQQLSREVAKRKEAEIRLAALNTELDQQIRDRTQELMQANRRMENALGSRKSAETKVSNREAILSAVASIGASALAADSWAHVLPAALQKLGESTGADRVYVFQNSVGERGQIITSQICEWDSQEIESHAQDPKLQRFDYRAQGFDRWEEILSQGSIISSHVSGLPEKERSFLAAQGIASILIVPIMTGFEWWGNIGFDSVEGPRTWSTAETDALNAAASIIGASILREEEYERTLLAWAKALELRDEETEGHTQRVTHMTVALAERLGCDEYELVNIRRGALLHDIGKMAVPDEILRKDGPLTEEQWQIMRRHPMYARDMLAPMVFLAPAISIPFSHHERWDGSGYPLGLRGKDIPFAARIFAVVDVWDALSSDRPYRKAWPLEKVIAHMQENSGTLFDPEILPTFFELLRARQVHPIS